MKSIIRALWFDRELVSNFKKANLNKAFLYDHLITGKITLEEYLQAIQE